MSKTKIPFRTLLKYALLHPWHIVAFAGSSVFGVANWSWHVWLGVFFVVEILMMVFILCMKPFHRYVRKELDNKADDKLLSTLREKEGAAYMTMKFRIDKFETITNNTLVVNECRRLLNLYHKLATTLNSIGEIPGLDRTDIIIKMGSLPTRSYNRSPTEQERYERLQQHLLLRDKNEADFKAVIEQLQSINELVDYTIEKASSFPANITKLRINVEESSTEMKVSEETLKEMEEFSHIDDSIGATL